jgi:hypothetical protein
MNEEHDGTRELRGKSLALPALLLALGITASGALLGRAWVRGRTTDEIIRVVGSARKPIKSDFIIWNSTLMRTASTVPTAYTALQADVKRVTEYLKRKGIAPKEIVPMATEVKTLYVRTKNDEATSYSDEDAGTYRRIAGYELSQSIQVRSSNVALVDDVSRQATELVGAGLSFTSDSPMYLYTKLSDLKVSMQAEAARDARARAAGIAEAGGGSLGALRWARMSTPQITPLYSAQENDGGSDDTSALDKKITAVVTAAYAVR